MAKKKIDNEIFKTLIEDYNIKDTNDIKDMLKDLLSGTIQTMLEELGKTKEAIKLYTEGAKLKNTDSIYSLVRIYYLKN